MKVRVNDRASDARAWGSPGLSSPAIVTVEIADTCPVCGGPRGTPTARPFHEDGVNYAVDCWTNPCGHVDGYAEVIREAAVTREAAPFV